MTTSSNGTLVGAPNYVCEYQSWLNILLVMLTTLIGITSLLVNGTAAVVFLRCHILQTPNNILVFFLAISDLCYTLVGLPTMVLIYTIEMDASATLSLKLSALFMLFFACMSIMTKVCISMHRYLSVVKPKCTYFSSLKRASLLMPVTLIFSILCSIPPLFGFGSHSLEVLVLCQTGLNRAWTYRVYLFVMSFVFPILLMSIFYYQIYKVIVEHSRVMDQGHVGKTKLLKVEQKTNTLMFTVLMTFCVSWLPFHIISICIGFLGNDVPAVVFSIAAIIACSSPVSNFFLYAVANRAYCKSIMKIICCRGPIQREMTLPVAQDTFAAIRTTHPNQGSVAPVDIHIPNVTVTVTKDTEKELAQIAMERRRSTAIPPYEIENEIQQRKRSVHRLSVIMLGELTGDCNTEYNSGSNQTQDSWTSPTKSSNLERVGEVSEPTYASPSASNGSPFLTVESAFERRRKTFCGERPGEKEPEIYNPQRNTVATNYAMGRKKKRPTLRSSTLKSNELDIYRKETPKRHDKKQEDEKFTGEFSSQVPNDDEVGRSTSYPPTKSSNDN